MKILLYSDVHWSTYSSIVRSREDKYSTRLNNLIKSVSWAEELATKNNCDSIFCLGDFFDKPELTSEEITALNEVKWSDLPHVFLVGNHEMGRNDLEFSSAHLFKLVPRVTIIDKITTCHIDDFTRFIFLPYQLNVDSLDIEDFPYKTIVFSHNDIKGIQLGSFISQSGYDINDIESKCDLFINGHIHNWNWISKKILNIGNLTGQNFSEDAFEHDHNAIILDTKTLDVDIIENPYAFNFYKIDMTSNRPFDTSLVKSNSVISLKCFLGTEETYRQLLDNISIASRLIIERAGKKVEDEQIKFNSVDHIKQFYDYILSILGNDPIIQEELSKL